MTQITQKGPQMDARGNRDPDTDRILRAFFRTYNAMGWGFLESVYKRGLVVVLRHLGADVRTEVHLPICLLGEKVGDHYADIVVDERVIVEWKTIDHIGPAHRAQVLNYLKATSFEIGLILNFGEKPTFERLIFSNARKGRPG
jgi:GxxExxY protein